MNKIVLVFTGMCSLVFTKAQVNYTWNGSSSTSWTTNTNWTPIGVPGTLDNVSIVAGANSCNLSASVSVANVTVTSGTLNLGGFILNASGDAVLTSGQITNGTLSVISATNDFATLSNPTFSSNATLNIVTGAITINGGTYGGPVSLQGTELTFQGAVFNSSVTATKTGTATNVSPGNNTFNGPVVLTQTGSGSLTMANSIRDLYNASSEFVNLGSNHMRISHNSSGNVFGGRARFTNTPATSTAVIYVASFVANNATFNDSIVVTNVNGGGISFGSNTGTSTLTAGRKIVVGNSGFNSGWLSLRNFTQLGATAQSLTLTGTAGIQYGPASSFGGNIVSVSPGLLFNGGVFSGSVTATKTGSGNDFSSGKNTFNAPLIIKQTGSGMLTMGNTFGDQYNATSEFVNQGSNNMRISQNSSGNIFGGRVWFRNSPIGSNFAIFVATSVPNNSTFNDSIVVTNVNGGGVYFGNGNGTCTLTAGKKIVVGNAGFNSGTLWLKNFSQKGPTAQGLVLTGTGGIQYGPSSTFDGDITSASPSLLFNGAVFNGSVTATKTGTVSDISPGNNTFNGPLLLTQTGSGGLTMANSSGDLYNSRSEFVNLGSNHMRISYNSSGNVFGGRARFTNTPATSTVVMYVASNVVNNAAFNDSIVVSNVNGGGVYFGDGNGTCTLTAGKKVVVGNAGFNSGTLWLKNFRQQGATAQSLALSGAGSIQYGPSSSFDGDITSASPSLLFSGAVFNGSVTATKTGTVNDVSIGNNTFNGPLVLRQTGGGYLRMGDGGPDKFNSISDFINQGSNSMYIAFNSSGNVFGGRARFTNTPSTSTVVIYVASNMANNSTFNDSIVVSNVNGGGINFGSNTGTSTLTAGRKILLGDFGFNSGWLVLRNFNQLGSTAQSFTLNGTGGIQYGASCFFGGNVVSVSPGLLFNGGVFNGSVTTTKTGASNDVSTGGNVFNGALVLRQTGSGALTMGNTNPDLYNASSEFVNQGSANMAISNSSNGNFFAGRARFSNQPTLSTAAIYVAAAGTLNATFNDSIVVNNVNGDGVRFGNSSGTATLTTGKKIVVGSSGFNSGTLLLKNFTQQGATAQSFSLTGTGGIQYGPSSSFDGDITSVSPSLLFSGAVFNGSVNAAKTGTVNQQCPGGNTFNGVTRVSNSGTGYLAMAFSASDTYNADVSFVQNGTGAMLPNSNTNCTYAGNISVTSASATPIVFGTNNGTAEFTGTAPQSISKTGSSANPTFRRLTISKTSNSLTLNTSINIPVLLTLNTGVINTNSTNVLVMNNGAATTIGNAASYINGPMNYDMALNGSRTLNFPIGKGPDWRPATLSVTHNNSTSYTYNSEVFNANAQGLGWTLPPTVSNVSLAHYWDIERTLTSTGVLTPSTNLSGNQAITLYYDTNDGVSDPTNLVVCKNTTSASTTWINIGGTGATIGTGSVTSTSAPSPFNSFSRFTLGNVSGGTNVLPIELISFNAEPEEGRVNLSWITASEKNNHHFEVERSRDGLGFEKVLSVEAGHNGTYSGRQSYAAVDLNPFDGLSYYRLKQVDLSDAFSYAPVVWVNISRNTGVEIFPNPVQNILHMNIAPGLGPLEVSMYSALGSQVVPATTLSEKSADIDVSHLTKGVYYLVFSKDSGLTPLKVVVE